MQDLIALGVVVTFLGFIAIDNLWPARTLPAIRGWRIAGIASFVLYMVIATYAPLAWGDLLFEHRLIDAEGLGTVGGAVVGALVLDLIQFSWHVALHRSSLLWRWFHQVHHAAERVDAAGAFYFSPLDALGFTFVGSVAIVWVVGITPEAAMIANLAVTFLAIFQHANIRTPVWLGYIVQRPEAHALHHGRDVHAFNYGSFVWWDWLAGTWRNPRAYTGENGLFDGSTYKLGAMLAGRDLVAEHADAARTNKWTLRYAPDAGPARSQR